MSFWYIIYHILSKFEIWSFWDFWPRVNFLDIGWPLIRKLTLRPPFCYIIYLLLIRFEIWPYMTPTLKFDPKPIFFLKITFRSYWSFWAIVRENWSNLWFLRNKTLHYVNRKLAIRPEVERILKKWVVKNCV